MACNADMGELVRGNSGGPEPLTMMLVSEIAEREGVEPTQLSPPIHTTVDIDALEKLLFDDGDGFVGVEFTYAGYQITVENREALRIDVE